MTMTPATSVGVPYTVPPEPSRLPSILMAAAVHAGLLGFLWVGISWQNTEPVAVTAEVWDMKTQDAAPPPPAPRVVEEVTPKPVPKVEPKPEPKVEPKADPKPTPQPKPAPAPKPVEKLAAPKPPDIALERQKQKELKQKEIKQKQLAEDQRERVKELKDKELKTKELKEKELKNRQDKKLADDQKAKELANENAARELADAKAKKAAEAKKAADEDKKMAKLRDAEMQRITGAAGSTGGTAPKATAPRIDSGYLASITAKIKGTTSYQGSTDVPGNPRAVFKIEELPTGEIISVRMIKSSGLPSFDDAVEKGIIKSSPLPKKKDGTVERTLEIGFSMKDLD